jgi:hypothetical protein
MPWCYITCSQVRSTLHAVPLVVSPAFIFSSRDHKRGLCCDTHKRARAPKLPYLLTGSGGALAGTPPFYFMHPMDAARAVANDKLRPTIPESLPSQVKYVVNRAHSPQCSIARELIVLQCNRAEIYWNAAGMTARLLVLVLRRC